MTDEAVDGAYEEGYERGARDQHAKDVASIEAYLGMASPAWPKLRAALSATAPEEEQ